MKKDFALLINIINESKFAFDVSVKGNLYRVIYKHDYINIIERIVDGKLERIENVHELEDLDAIYDLVEGKVKEMNLRRNAY